MRILFAVAAGVALALASGSLAADTTGDDAAPQSGGGDSLPGAAAGEAAFSGPYIAEPQPGRWAPPRQPPPVAVGGIVYGSTSGSASGGSTFDRLDRNGDGYLSREEAARDVEIFSIFRDLDVDMDGRISRHEWDKVDMSR